MLGAGVGRARVDSDLQPRHYALRHARAQDYEGFFEEEIRPRKNLNYPPFVALASLLIHGEDLTRVQTTAGEIRDALDAANSGGYCRVLAPPPPARAPARRDRVQLLIKSRTARASRCARHGIGRRRRLAPCDLNFVNVEIDPVI